MKPCRSSNLSGILFATLLGLLTACSHDTQRANPLDPVRTPPIELTVAVDDTAGTTTLAWSAYAGAAQFSEYLVLRQVFDRLAVDTLGVVSFQGTTSWVDSSALPNTAYLYRVSVVNAAGFEATSGEVRAQPLDLPGVPITGAAFDAATATVQLAWSAYTGPRFRSYRIERTTSSTRKIVFESDDLAVTSCTDTGLLGATDYSYRVIVVTDRGEEVAGVAATGSIHGLLPPWPLDLQSVDPSLRENVRLYAEADGRVVALIASGSSVRLAFYDPADGSVQEVDVGLTPRINLGNRAWEGDAVAMALSALGQRYVVLPFGGSAAGITGVVPLSAEGRLVWLEREPFGTDPVALADEMAIVRGEVQFGNIVRVASRSAGFEGVEVSIGEKIVLADDFLDLGEDDVGAYNFHDRHTYGRWLFSGWANRTADHGGLIYAENVDISHVDLAWQDFRFAADLYLEMGQPYIQIGGVPNSRLRLLLDAERQEAVLEWHFRSPARSDLPDQDMSWREPMAIMPGVRYQLALEAVDGHVRATVTGPDLQVFSTQTTELRAGGVAAGADGLFLSFEEQAFFYDNDGTLNEVGALESWVSEVRVWRVGAERFSRIGVCLPEAGKVLSGLASLPSRWSRSLPNEFGPLIAADKGFLAYPISFDGAATGAMYVLDAGDSRIVVFGQDGTYVTEWGTRGSAPGQFDFGSGAKRPFGLDYRGSAAVDASGVIHVADVGNGRIQRFAP